MCKLKNLGLVIFPFKAKNQSFLSNVNGGLEMVAFGRMCQLINTVVERRSKSKRGWLAMMPEGCVG